MEVLLMNYKMRGTLLVLILFFLVTLLAFAMDEDFSEAILLVQELKEKTETVDAQDQNGRTALMEAAGKGNIPEVRALLEAGADPNIRDNKGRTALMNAWKEAAILLLEAGADPNIKDNDGETAIYHSRFGSRDELELLVNAGADINAADNRGYTPLLSVLRYNSRNDWTYVQNLLSLGADPLIRTNDGKTSLLCYCQSLGIYNTYSELVEKLLEYGVDPAAADMEGNSPVRMVLESGWESTVYDYGKVRSMILHAASRQDLASVKAQIRKERQQERRQEFSQNPEKYGQAALLLLPLTYIGLSIWTREGIYQDNPRDNWMAPLNASLTMAAGGAVAGYLLTIGITGGDLGGAFLAIATGLVTGLIGGIAAYSVPGLRNAFADTPFLYYIPSAAMAVIFGVGLYFVWNY
jgi:ankyrin repeat protein